jgi:hypothetical protein
MSSHRILHQITLPKASDAKPFESFMRDSYFPSVHTGATRVGVITGLTLSRCSGSPSDSVSFLLDMGFSGLAGDQMPRIDDEQVRASFDAFGAEVTYIGTYLQTLTLGTEDLDDCAADADAC